MATLLPLSGKIGQKFTHANYHTTSTLLGRNYTKIAKETNNVVVSFTIHNPSIPTQGVYTDHGYLFRVTHTSSRYFELPLNEAIKHLRRCDQDWMVESMQITAGNKIIYVLGNKTSDPEIQPSCAKACLISYRKLGLSGLPNTFGRKHPHIGRE